MYPDPTPASYLRSQFTSSSNFCTYKINNLHGGGAGLCIGVWLRMCNIGCALELRPKILKIFTRNTDSTVNGLRALLLVKTPKKGTACGFCSEVVTPLHSEVSQIDPLLMATTLKPHNIEPQIIWQLETRACKLHAWLKKSRWSMCVLGGDC